MKTISLMILMVLFGTPVFAECTHIDIAELQEMSEEELTSLYNKYEKEADYYSKMAEHEKMGSLRYEDFEEQHHKCWDELIRVLNMKSKKFPKVKTNPTSTVSDVRKEEAAPEAK